MRRCDVGLKRQTACRTQAALPMALGPCGKVVGVLASVLLALLVTRFAEADEVTSGKSKTVRVKVVEVGGGRAYLSPGRAQHVRVGDLVRIAGGRYSVVAVNDKNFSVDLKGRGLKRGQRGVVSVVVEKSKLFQERPTPRPLSAFAGAWGPVPRPAEAQHPKLIVLGPPRDTRRNRLVLALDHVRIMPLSGPAYAIARTRLRARLHAELGESNLVLDADGFAELWQATDLDLRPQNASRPLINLRQLELSYAGERLTGGVGRLRYASSVLGMLDGARVSGNLTETWSIGAFGGAVADPRDGSVSTEAQRFGGEVVWYDASSDARPRAVLSAHGSRYLDGIDERRLTGSVESYPSFGRLGARAEVSFFDEDNLWNASPVELTALSGDASVKLDQVRLSSSLDMRRPERSLWLAAFLPAGYFCTAVPEPGVGGRELCVGGDARYSASLTAAWEQPAWTLSAGSVGSTTRPGVAEQLTGFVNFRHLEVLENLRVDAGASASTGSLMQSAGLQLGAGFGALGDSADLSVQYRPRVTRYRALGEGLMEHGAGGRLWWSAAADVDVSLSADFLLGQDVDVATLFASMAWRPRF